MSMLTVTVSNAACGVQSPYIYCLLARAYGCAYVGQTFSQYGFLGRLSQHLSGTSAATFRRQLTSICRLDASAIDGCEVVGYAARLPNTKQYGLQDYREAVEFLVQCDLINLLAKSGTAVTVVSRVRGNGYTKLQYIRSASSRISSEFYLWLHGCCSDLT